MRTAIALLFLLLPGMASARQDLQSYTPERTIDAPTFINAEVVRVNRDNTATFRSESGEITLTAEGAATDALDTLHAGDKVLVEYREVKGADGRVSRYVSSVKSASPSSGEPGRGRTVAARLTAGSTVRARVLSYDKRRRRVNVIDESGGLRSLSLRSGITGLDALIPGSNVAFNLGAGGAGAVAVTGITPLGNTPVFAGNNAFPPINAQFVNFNSRTGIVTLDTATAGRLSFPVTSAVASGITGLRPGDSLNFGFDVTGGQPVAGTTGFTAGPVANITGFQPITSGGSSTGLNTGTVAGAPTGVVTGTVGVVPAVGGQNVGTVPASNTVGGFAVGGTPDTGATGATPTGTGTVGGPVTVGGGAVGSPVGNQIPNIPAATPVAGVVLPPAGAKDPLSANDVGMMRAQGERDLDAAAVSLAAVAAAIDPVWAGFKSQCLSGFTVSTVTSGREWYLLADNRIPAPTDDACRGLHANLTGRVQGFLSQVETVEDAARKADVLPVRVREVFDRHKLR